MSQIGKSVQRVDARDKATGKAKYPADFNFHNAVILKTLFCRRAHAQILSFDASEAEALPGVLAVITAKDVPVNEYGLTYFDQPVICGLGSGNKEADSVRFEGDVVAFVLAESEAIAEEAMRLIQIEYHDLPLMNSLEKALAPDAYLLHPQWGSNIFHHNRIRHGNADEAFAGCHVIVEGEYQTPVQEHAYMQPEAGVGYMDSDGVITLVTAGQWTHEDQIQVSHALDIPTERVRVIYPAIGGAFGGREDMSVQILIGLGVKALHEKGISRPVKAVWNREESMIGHHKRHAYTMRAKWGADANGKILAVKCEIWADAGAYAYTSTKVLGNATLLASGPYEIPNVCVDAYAVFTNAIPAGAFRGFGGPQAAFMAESQVNKLAEALNMDPVELRMRNLYKEGSIISMGSVIPKGVSIREVLRSCALRAGWTEGDNGWEKPVLQQPKDPNVRVGLGIACGFKNVGYSYGAPENCGATVILEGDNEIEKAHLYHSAAEVGQGTHTAIAQMLAEALGITMEKLVLHYSDTSNTFSVGSVSASRMTFMAGNSVIGASKIALKRWEEGNRPAMGAYVYRPPATSRMDKDDGHCVPNFAYGYVAEAVLVEVNLQSGDRKLRKVICVDDVGKAINPAQLEGQIEGAVLQCSGYLLMEDWKVKDGYALSKHFSSYLIPTVLDIPDETESILYEHPDPIGPFGARGMGEMPTLPFAPAVAEAMYQSTGVRFNSFPITGENFLRTLGKLTPPQA